MTTEALLPLAPNSIGEFTAYAAAEARMIPTGNGGTLSHLRRSYTHGEQQLELEISDALHTPILADLVKTQQGTVKQTGASTFRGMLVAGYPALVQWQATSRTAFANLLIGNRLLVNLLVKPTDSAEAAVTLVSLLALKEVERLALTPTDGAPAPAAVPEPEPAPAAPTKATDVPPVH